MFLVGYITGPLLVRKSVKDDMANSDVDNSIFFDKAEAYLNPFIQNIMRTWFCQIIFVSSNQCGKWYSLTLNGHVFDYKSALITNISVNIERNSPKRKKTMNGRVQYFSVPHRFLRIPQDYTITWVILSWRKIILSSPQESSGQGQSLEEFLLN